MYVSVITRVMRIVDTKMTDVLREIYGGKGGAVGEEGPGKLRNREAGKSRAEKHDTRINILPELMNKAETLPHIISMADIVCTDIYKPIALGHRVFADCVRFVFARF